MTAADRKDVEWAKTWSLFIAAALLCAAPLFDAHPRLSMFLRLESVALYVGYAYHSLISLRKR